MLADLKECEEMADNGEDKDGGGNFYAGDEDIPLIKQDMIVNAWRELPERYEGK